MFKHGFVIVLLCLYSLSEYTFSESLYGNRTTRQSIQDKDKDGVINARDRCPNTPLKAKVDHYGCHKTTLHKLYVELNVLFETDSHVVRPQYYSEVKKLADFMRDNPSSKVVIEGHTDNTGSKEYNQILSQNRAQAITEILVYSFRIKKSRIKTIGYGEQHPLSPNHTHKGKRTNRRVVAEISMTTKVDINKWNIYSVDEKR